MLFMKKSKKGDMRAFDTRKTYASGEELERQLRQRGYQLSGMYGPPDGRIPKGTHVVVLKN